MNKSAIDFFSDSFDISSVAPGYVTKYSGFAATTPGNNGKFINESQDVKLQHLVVKLIFDKNASIEDITTGIRIIKGVATVSQLGPSDYSLDGNKHIKISISFDSQGMDPLEYIDAFSRLAKKQMKTIKMIVIYTLDDKKIRDSSGMKKLVY